MPLVIRDQKMRWVSLAEDTEKIWYHGRLVSDPTFNHKYIGNGYDREGPGFYFSNSEKDARSYAGPGGILMTVQLIPRKLIPDAKAKSSEVQKLMKMSPDFEGHLTNWDENPAAAFKTALSMMLTQGPAKDVFLQVWYDFYRYSPADYAKNMISLGYDGFIIDKDSVTHAIIYNPDIIKVLKVEPIDTPSK